MGELKKQLMTRVYDDMGAELPKPDFSDHEPLTQREALHLEELSHRVRTVARYMGRPLSLDEIDNINETLRFESRDGRPKNTATQG